MLYVLKLNLIKRLLIDISTEFSFHVHNTIHIYDFHEHFIDIHTMYIKIQTFLNNLYMYIT